MKFHYTEVPVLMGKHNTKTKLDVFKKKLETKEDRKSNNEIVIAHNQFYEKHAIDEFCFLMGVQPDRFDFPEHDFLSGKASACFDEHGYILLVKTPYKTKTLEITESHIIEANALMLMYDKPVCYVMVYDADHDKDIRKMISFDKKIQQEIIDFAESCLSEIEFMSSIDVSDLVEQYDHLTQAIELATEQKKEVLSQIIIKCGEKESVINGRKLQKIIRKGNVDYSKIKALKGIDLEAYRRKSSAFWKLC